MKMQFIIIAPLSAGNDRTKQRAVNILLSKRGGFFTKIISPRAYLPLL